jgi:cobalt-zinc-cadmium efflux system membrane fusion protein
MVLHVCRRVLGNATDAEDAFQAVFLVLTRNAASLVTRPFVGDWLHGVARRTSLCARRADARRRAREQAAALPDAQVAAGRNDWLPLLDEELGRLPPHYRQAIVLCDLQDQTRREAARQLGIPEGTMATRLTRARALLAKRLLRRGMAISGTALAAAFSGAVRPALAGPVVVATASAAASLATGQECPEVIGARAAELSKRVLNAMWLSKLKRNVLMFLVLGVIAFGGVISGFQPVFGTQERSRGDLSPLRLSPEQVSELGIRTAPAQARARLSHLVREIGTIHYDDDGFHVIRSRFPGEILETATTPDAGKKRALRYGDAVKKGQLLAVLWSKDLAERKSALVGALCKLHLSRETVERLRKLAAEGAVPIATLREAEQRVQADSCEVLTAERTLRLWKMSDEEIHGLKEEALRILKNESKRDAKTEAARCARVEIRAPADGTVIEINTSPGDLIDPVNSPPLFKIADLRRLRIQVRIPGQHELQLRRLLREGTSLKWKVSFPSELTESSPLELNIHQFAPGSRGAGLLLIGYLDNTGGKYLVGQFVHVAIPLPQEGSNQASAQRSEVVVPASAVVDQSGAAFVVVQPDPRKPAFEARRVPVVRRGGGTVHLRARLLPGEERQGFQIVRPGESIVTAGATALKALIDDRESGDR